MIPVASTTIAVWRKPVEDDHGEPLDPLDPQPARASVATGIRAVISSSRRGEMSAGTQEVVYFRLTCDLVSLEKDDVVEDEKTGEMYSVIGPRRVNGVGAVSDYMRADMKQVEGVVSEPRENARALT